jgi:hypothetical protein
MVRPVLALLLTMPLAGCLPLQLFDTPAASGVTPIVPSGPFANPASLPGPVVANYAQAPTDTCLYVDRVGRDVLAANPDVGLRPGFATIGKDHPEIFHQGTMIVYITEGLVKRCKGEGQLAALLCLELGKMVAEREALGPRPGEAEAPLQVAIGNTASPGAVDLVALAERGKFENDRKRVAKRRQPPDPAALAATYLRNSGHGSDELLAVGPLLAEAEKNYLIEKQFNGARGASWRAVAPAP